MIKQWEDAGEGTEGGGRDCILTIGAFIEGIGCGSSLSRTLRAIDKHSLEHVWVVVGGEKLYYHLDSEVLDGYSLDTVISHVGAGCIGWDGSGWEFSWEEPFTSMKAVSNVRSACLDAHTEYHSAKLYDSLEEYREDIRVLVGDRLLSLRLEVDESLSTDARLFATIWATAADDKTFIFLFDSGEIFS